MPLGKPRNPGKAVVARPAPQNSLPICLRCGHAVNTFVHTTEGNVNVFKSFCHGEVEILSLGPTLMMQLGFNFQVQYAFAYREARG